MAVKSVAEVTIVDETDIDKLVTWYKLQSGSTAPSAPTTTQTSSSVSGWVTSEPQFTSGNETNYLYTVIQTQWKDGSCTWGSVQLSSSYEQAKQAWNKANAVQTTANNAFDNAELALSSAETYAAEAENNAIQAANAYTNGAIANESAERQRFVSELTGGVFVHPKDIESEGVRITDVIDVIRDSEVVARFGEETVIGALNGTHVSISDDRLSFFAADGSEVAYIATVDNESVFYMTKAIVVNELRFGDWMFFSRDNGNLVLKWIGDI